MTTENILFGPSGVRGFSDAAVREQACELVRRTEQLRRGPARCICAPNRFFDFEYREEIPKGEAGHPLMTLRARLLAVLLQPSDADIDELFVRSRDIRNYYIKSGRGDRLLYDFDVGRLLREVATFRQDADYPALASHRPPTRTLFGYRMANCPGPGFEWMNDFRVSQVDRDWAVVLWWGDTENDPWAAFPHVIGWAHTADLYRSLILLLAHNYWPHNMTVRAEFNLYGPEPPPEPWNRGVQIPIYRESENDDENYSQSLVSAPLSQWPEQIDNCWDDLHYCWQKSTPSYTVVECSPPAITPEEVLDYARKADPALSKGYAALLSVEICEAEEDLWNNEAPDGTHHYWRWPDATPLGHETFEGELYDETGTPRSFLIELRLAPSKSGGWAVRHFQGGGGRAEEVAMTVERAGGGYVYTVDDVLLMN